uniref:ATP synthase complex subunit 8 n=1 Tax=Cerambycidae sp. 4 KM-2017 TaxID=2219289 RepID=A0A346RGA2_9CUCU|nr:ATP synthase F0 subunit 8 [Cerambycidae sp. 4 KM-2017]
MPQMMPLNWLMLFLFFLIVFLLFNIINYYSFKPFYKKSLINFKNKKSFNWKW